MEWISVEDRWPDQDEQVLWTDGYEVWSAELIFMDGEELFASRLFNFDTYEKPDPTHWMPMIKFPKQ